MRQKYLLSALACLAAFLAPLLVQRPTRSGPSNLEEVVVAAARLGLRWLPDGMDLARTHRVVLSAHPLNRDEVGTLRCNEARPGMVACYYPWQAMVGNLEPESGVLWGQIYVTGDPELIAALTGMRPGRASSTPGTPKDSGPDDADEPRAE